MALRRSPDNVVIDGRIEEAASKRHLRGVSAHRDRVRQQAEPSCLIFFLAHFNLTARNRSETTQRADRSIRDTGFSGYGLGQPIEDISGRRRVGQRQGHINTAVCLVRLQSDLF